MGWRGTLRSLEADARRRERAARQRQRELERQRAQLEKMQEMERAAYEVQVYENHIDVLLSVHKDCAEPWDWERIHSAGPPAKPKRSDEREKSAQVYLDTFKPGITDKLLKRTEPKREVLVQAVAQAREEDEAAYQEALKAYEQDFAEWEATRELAGRVLEGDLGAFMEAIAQARPFQEIEGLGSSVKVHADDTSVIQVTWYAAAEDVIPKETRALLKSGKLSVKAMTKSRFYDLYQDWVCGCALRLASEVFALLPFSMVIVTAESEILNAQTGHMETQPILSVAIPRKTLDALNLETLDPSDSMNNFVHQMKFLKTQGFRPVDALTRSQFET